MLQHSKAYYRTFAHNGYEWGGQTMPGIQFFVKRNAQGYLEMLIDDAGLQNGDFQFMAERGLSLTKEEARKRSKRFVKQLEKQQ